MSFVIRPFESSDAKQWFEVHHAAVRQTATSDYSQAVIDAWASSIDAAKIEYLMADQSGAKLVAELDGEIVGIGEIALGNCELRACYVSPRFGRQGVGKALVAELEAIAKATGITALTLDSSVTAERFYRDLGYEVSGQGQHVLHTGEPMACVLMTKVFQ